jgi:hypothetical protein
MRSLLFASFIFCQSGFSQLIPNLFYDQGWQVVYGMNDEFSTGTSYNTDLWTYCPAPGWADANGATCLQGDNNNISVQSGYIRLSIRSENCSCHDEGTPVNKSYSSGGLLSLTEQQYGYFEVRFRITDIPAPPATLEGLAASAWLWRSWQPFNCIWSEIDLAEMDAVDHRQTCNVIFDPDECDVSFPGLVPIPSQENMRCGNTDPCVPIGDTYLASGWHTYATVWNPNGIAIYVDNVLMNKTTIGCPGMEPLNWILGPGSGEYQFTNSITPNTQLPFHMDIDYVRAYKLQVPECNTTISTCSFNFSTYNDRVKNSITIGGSGCSNTMPTSGNGSRVYLRAVNYVQINGEFTVPLGSELTIETLGSCY